MTNPTTEQVRTAYQKWSDRYMDLDGETWFYAGADFDRWLAAVKSEGYDLDGELFRRFGYGLEEVESILLHWKLRSKASVLGSVYQDNVPLIENSAGNHIPDLDKILKRPKWWQKGGRVQ